MESHHHLSTAVTDRSVFRTFALFFTPTVFTLDPVSFSIRSRSLFSSCAALHDSRPVFVAVNQLRSKKGHYSVPLCQSNGKLIGRKRKKEEEGKREEKGRKGGRAGDGRSKSYSYKGGREGRRMRRREKWFLSSRRIVCSVFLVDGIARIGSWFVMGVGNSLSDVVATSSPPER